MRLVRAATTITILTSALVLSTACGGASPEGPVAAEAPLARTGPRGAPPLAVPSTPPRKLTGVEVDLGAREAAIFWQVVSQIYAPCPSEAVSLRACVEEARACGACLPAARLLAHKVQQGASIDVAREIYAERFGPDRKIVDAADSPSRGPEGAPVTIMVWSDFECPHCRRAMPVLDRMVEKYGGHVRLVHKLYPLAQHTFAGGAARAAIAAQVQGKYWEMERALFAHPTELGERDLERHAAGIGLDVQRFRADMSSAKATRILARDHDDAARAGLTSTPFILVNGREVRLDHWKLDRDLDDWIALELTLLGVSFQREK